MSSEVNGVKNFFASRQVPLSDEWLESCINWCKEEYLGSTYTLKELQLKIFEQWLLLDLRDLEISSLPANLSSQKKYILNGNYSLQVMQIIDISRPKHWQLQRIRGDAVFTKNNWQESDAIGTGKRVLQLTLTDGVQQVEAMEYRFIPFININLPPGIKVRLVGPITVRRGILMLEEGNIKILGGEVEEIAVTHAAENVLARKLNLPENPHPQTVTEQMDIENEDSTQVHASNQSRTLAVGMVQVPNTRNVNHPVASQAKSQVTNSRNFDPKSEVSYVQAQSNSNRPEVDFPQVNEFPDIEDELRISQEIDLLLEAESELAPPTKILKSNPRTNSPDLFNDDFDIPLSNFDNIEPRNHRNEMNRVNENVTTERKSVFEVKDNPNSSTNPCKPESTELVTVDRKTSENEIVNLSDSLDDNADDIFACIDVDVHLNEAVSTKTCSQNTGMNIEKLKRNMASISKGIFKLKAKFKTVVEKLTMADNSYKMVIRIEDGSGELDVKLCNEIVSDFAGYCAEALISLKSSILENDESAKFTVLKAMSRVKEKLLQLDSMMEIQINREEGIPTVIRIL